MPVPVETPYGPLDAVADWLRANDIDPNDVPINGPIAIDEATADRGRLIRYTAMLRNEAGRHYADESTGDVAQEERVVPLAVEPPANVQVRDVNGS